ncbi:MAG: hypothetical protein AMS16_06045 [Planctomycetes bacterium DG_58]|nr:MAG: hypothetical protein AMS16_06045 [Planctomycetes bacterium DG_58]
MRRTVFVLLLSILAVAAASYAQDAKATLPIRKDHPRILFNADQLPAIRQKVAGPFAKEYAQMKALADKRVDEVLAEDFIEKAVEQQPTKKGKPWDGLEEIGLLWHLTKDERYKQAGLRLHELLMKRSELTIAAVREQGRQAQLAIRNRLQHTGPLYLSYDLFHDVLDEPTRQKSVELGIEIIRLKRKSYWMLDPRRLDIFHAPGNIGKDLLGFYGDTVTKEEVEAMNDLANYFDDTIHAKYLPGFAAKAAHRGGWNECFQCMCMTLSHEMPFWWCWRNGTTAEEHRMYTTNPLFTGMANWIVYNVMDWRREKPENTAVPVGGKAPNHIGLNGTYWTVPLSRDPVGAWFIKQVSRQSWYPPPLWERILVEEPGIPEVKPEELPETAIFEGWGWVSMRSDWTADGVFAHVTCGLTGQAEPADLDDTSFIIYHKGLLAIDGIKPAADAKNTDPYSRQTLGHNTITVLDPDEVLRGNHCYQYTWRPNPFPVNDGGQSWKGLGERNYAKTSAGLDFPEVRGPSHMARLGWITGYQTSPRYDYTCMDGTKCYSEKKMKHFTRQFVFLKPNCFVVFDRVVSTKPEFRKRWHLHCQNEPTIDGRLVHADHEGGRLYCEPLLPEKATLKKVQGARLEQADGTYVIPEGWKDSPTDTWRLDVGPSEARTDDVFLHVLQAVDAGQPRTFTSRKIERDGKIGVEVTVGERRFEVLFAGEGDPTGHISVTDNGKAIADRDFPTRIEDTYALWKDDPRFKMWMTDDRFRYVIRPADRKRFGR